MNNACKVCGGEIYSNYQHDIKVCVENLNLKIQQMQTDFNNLEIKLNDLVRVVDVNYAEYRDRD